MPNTYTELYFHFVWSIKGREALISDQLEARLFRYIRHKCSQLGATVHALNGMPDHVHLAVSLPASLSVSKFIHDVKGSSARFANDEEPEPVLYWQEGYGALTFAKRDLGTVVAYISGQKEHHRSGKLSAKMERCEEDA